MAQMPQPIRPHSYDEDTGHDTGLQSLMAGEDVQHQEKQYSVLKKVKAKAKKIKDKLTPHGHGGDEHDEEEEEEEEDDETEEIVQDPEIHGAPIYESAAVRSAASVPGEPGGNLEKPSVKAEDRYGGQSWQGVNLEQPAGSNYLERPSVKAENRHDDSHTVRPFGHRQEENSGLGKPSAMSTTTDTHAPADLFNNPGGRHGDDVNTGKSRGGIGEETGMEVDPHSPGAATTTAHPSNYETKVANPTGQGGKEVGITSLLHSLDEMGIHDDSNPKSKPEEGTKVYTGSHDQFSPEIVPKSFDPDKPDELPRDTLSATNPANPSSYTEKMSSATSAIAGKAVAAKDVIASKLGGYTGGGGDTAGPETNAPKSTSPTGYAQKVAATVTEKLAPVYGKVAGAGSAVITKVPGVGTGQAQQGIVGTGQEGHTTAPDKGVSVTSYLTEKLKPGDEDKALSEVITHAFSRGEEKRKVTEPNAAGDSHSDRPITEGISDALHKREPQDEFGEGRPMGKVTESEEVAKQLGTGKEECTDVGVEGNVNAEKGVVDRLKGAVSSWMGKGGETQSSAGTTVVSDEGLPSPATAEDDSSRSKGERKLQASAY